MKNDIRYLDLHEHESSRGARYYFNHPKGFAYIPSYLSKIIDNEGIILAENYKKVNSKNLKILGTDGDFLTFLFFYLHLDFGFGNCILPFNYIEKIDVYPNSYAMWLKLKNGPKTGLKLKRCLGGDLEYSFEEILSGLKRNGVNTIIH